MTVENTLFIPTEQMKFMKGNGLIREKIASLLIINF